MIQVSSAPAPSLAPAMLLLGSSGFIGGHLARLACAHAGFGAVELVGKRPDPSLPGSARLLLCQELDSRVLAGCGVPDVIVWAMGGASVGASMLDPGSDRMKSIPPLEKVLDRMAEAWPASHLIFLSSAAVYGRFGSASTGVKTVLSPVSPYGQHKALSESLIAARLPPGKFTIVRPFSVYGTGLRRQVLWDALEKLMTNDTTFFGQGTELRDWVHVADFTRLITDIALDPGAFPSILNAGTGVGTSVANVLGMLFSAAGTKVKPSFAGIARSGDPEHLVACAAEQLPYTRYFSKPLAEGLREYAAWHKSEGRA